MKNMFVCNLQVSVKNIVWLSIGLDWMTEWKTGIYQVLIQLDYNLQGWALLAEEDIDFLKYKEDIRSKESISRNITQH
jgi:hypothetical protein